VFFLRLVLSGECEFLVQGECAFFFFREKQANKALFSSFLIEGIQFLLIHRDTHRHVLYFRLFRTEEHKFFLSIEKCALVSSSSIRRV
jgi:hypothetical protein